MKDIAALAGVSVGTVDRALNSRGRIAPDVEQRILMIAEKLDYKKRPIEKSTIFHGKSLKIAVVLHIYQNDFYKDIMQGILRAEERICCFGITVEIYHCKDFDVKDQLHQIKKAIANGASALAIVPIDDILITEELMRLHRANFPVVFLASMLNNVPCFSAVHCDYKRSGMIAAGLIRLISGGKGKALVFHPSFMLSGHRLRIDSLKNTLKENARDFVIENVIELPNDSFDSYKLTSQELEMNQDINFIVYCGSTRAGLKALGDCGRDLHAIFYDCTPETREALAEGKIDAAILQDPQEQGYCAIMVLSDFFTLNKVPKPVIEIPNQILLRESIL